MGEHDADDIDLLAAHEGVQEVAKKMGSGDIPK
jgi:hypothetical protein